MAQGGGRGWFHRKRHQPEADSQNGTPHAASGSSADGSAALNAAPQGNQHHDQARWSPEAGATSPVPSTPAPPIDSPTTAPPPAPSSAPSEESLQFSRMDDAEPDPVQPADGSTPGAVDASAMPRPAGSWRRTEDSAYPLVADPAQAGNTPTQAGALSSQQQMQQTQFRQGQDDNASIASVAGTPAARAVTSIDWDVATAAALADDPGATAAETPHAGSTASADRLLEDLIREIVGDAAADTVSSLHAPRTAPSPSNLGPTSDDLSGPTADTTEGPQGVRVPAELTDGSAPTHELRNAGSDSTTPLNGSRAEVGQAAHDAADGATAHTAPSSTPQFAAQDVAALGPAGESESVMVAAATNPALQGATSGPAAVENIEARAGADARAVDATLSLRTRTPAAIAESAHTTDAPEVVSRETPALLPAPIPVSRETDIQHGGSPLADQLAEETRRRIALDEAVLPLPASTRVLTISNQKGGVGKTTSAVNLAAALARSGAHVLVIDLDPQGNASTALGVDHRSEQQSVYDVLVADLPLADVVRPSTEHESLDCVPATIHLAGAEIELVSLVAREQRLRRALDRHLADMERPYDYVFIDCPPSLGLLTINAFVAAREVLIPIQCEYYALEGLSQLLSNIELIEKHLNPELRLSTILLTMYDSRTNLAQQVAQEVREHFPAQTLETIIPRSVRVSEAPSYGQSVISYDFSSSGSLSYREAAAEIALRGAANQKDTH